MIMFPTAMLPKIVPFRLFLLPFQSEVSSSGPRGGASAPTPDASVAGHGGDGRCPELLPQASPIDPLLPMADAVPRKQTPKSGEPGLAVFYGNSIWKKNRLTLI